MILYMARKTGSERRFVIRTRRLNLPADSGLKLRNGKALAVGLTSSETSPNDRRTATQRLWPAPR